jgi:hypothetical protein
MQDEVDLRDVFGKAKDWVRYLTKKWIIIVVAGLLGGAIGLYKAYRTETLYVAVVSFVLEDDKSSSMGINGIASQLGFDLGGESNGGGAFSGSNLMGLIKSRFLIERALLLPITINQKQQSFADYYIEFNNWRQNWTSEPELRDFHYLSNADRTTYTLRQDSVLGEIFMAISKQITVTPKDKSLLLSTITLKSPNELFAKFFTESLCREVSAFYIQTKTKKARNNVTIIQRQTDSVRSELNMALGGVAVSTDETYNLNPAYLRAKVPSQRRQFDVQSNMAILTELVKNLELAKVSLLKETPLIQAVDLPILPLAKERASKRNGLVIGGLLGGIIIILVLVLRRLWRNFNQ